MSGSNLRGLPRVAIRMPFPPVCRSIKFTLTCFGGDERMAGRSIYKTEAIIMSIPTTMRALRQTSLNGPQDLRLIADAQVPSPGPG